MKNLYANIVLLVMLSLGNAQTTYYVDANSGDDNNNGTSDTTPWKTIDKINEQSFLPGDIILFKRGEIWIGDQLEVSGYSGTENNYITFGAYPDSDDPFPVISTITSHSLTWTEQSGNIWIAKNPPSYHPERIWVDDKEILRANKQDELDGINFLWLYDKEEEGDLYLYSDTDPSSKKIEYTNGKIPLYMEDTKYIKFTNIDFQGGWCSIYINGDVSYITFDDTKIGKFSSSGIDINSENTAPSHLHIMNSSFDSDFTLDYSMAPIYRGTDSRGCGDGIFMQCAEYCEINDCYFKNWGHASINIDGNPYESETVKVSYIKVHHNTATSPDITYGGRIAIDDAHHCEMYNNLIINTSVQSQLNGYENHIHHNIIDGTTNTPILDNSDEISAGIDISSYSNVEVKNNIYENNLIMNIEGVGIQITTNGYYNIHDNIIRNNIIYNCGSVQEVKGIGILIQEDYDDCHTSNNIFSNNLIYNTETTETISFFNQIMNVSDFNSENGYQDYTITNNISSDPLFIDEANRDYHLQDTSPCIDAGTTALAAYDYEDNPIPYPGTVTDIGIYEYQQLGTLIENTKKITNTTYRVYPNPVKDFFKLHTQDMRNIEDIKLFNINGQIIRNNIRSNQRINTSSLANGVYFLRITQTDNIKVLKFLLVK